MKEEIRESDSGAGLSSSTDTGIESVSGTIETNATKDTIGDNSLGLGSADKGLEYTLEPDENLAEFVVNTIIWGLLPIILCMLRIGF